MTTLDLYREILIASNSGVKQAWYDFDRNTQGSIYGMLKRNNNIKDYKTTNNRTRLIVIFKEPASR